RPERRRRRVRATPWRVGGATRPPAGWRPWLSCHTDRMASSTSPQVSSLGRQARERFVVHVSRVLPEIGQACQTRLLALMDEPGSSRERQDRRDACQAFLVVHATWVDNCRRALQRSLLPPQRVKAADTTARQGGRLELLAEGVMDNQILASRLALRVLDLAS